jgi:uncharacterized membrane protein
MFASRTIDIAAPTDVVWDVLADVERWPSWTASIKSVELPAGEQLREGAAVRVQPLGGPLGTWDVTTFTPGREFSWQFKAPGVLSLGTHVIEPVPGGSRVTLGVRQTGPGTWLLRPWLSRINRRNLVMEAEGLRRASEARAAELRAAR